MVKNLKTKEGDSKCVRPTGRWPSVYKTRWSYIIYVEYTLHNPGGGTPLYGLYGDVPLDRVWFFTPPVLNRVYNFKLLCPKQGLKLS